MSMDLDTQFLGEPGEYGTPRRKTRDRNVIIILEGCDGAGKSTYAENLRRLYGAHGWDTWTMHFGWPDENIGVVETHINPLTDWLTAAEAKGGRNVLIVDRFHIGEIVYGDMLRGGGRLDHESREKIDDFLREHDAILLYVAPGIDTILERFEARGDDLIKIDQLVKISTAYDQLLLNDPEWTVVNEVHQNMLMDTVGGVL